MQRLSQLDLTWELKFYLKLCAANGFTWALFSKQFVDDCVQNSQPSLANCTHVETQKDSDLQIHSRNTNFISKFREEMLPSACQELGLMFCPGHT